MQKIFIWIMVLHSFLNAFEVNTHQALTRCAAAGCLGNPGAQNLYDFVNFSGIGDMNYVNEIFERYKTQNNKNVSYIDYANEGTGFEQWNISVKPNFFGMIEAGSVLEDAVYPSHDFAGDGRFNNHFYAAQFDSEQKISKYQLYKGEPNETI